MEDMSCQPLVVDPKKHFLSRSEFDVSLKEHYPSRSDIYDDPIRSKTAYGAYWGSAHKVNMSKGMIAVPAIYEHRVQCGIRNAVTATKTAKDSREMVTILVHRRCSGTITAELRWYRPFENISETNASPEEFLKDDESLETLIDAEMRSTDAPEELSDNNDFVIWLESCLDRFARQSYETRQRVIRCRSCSSAAVVEGNGKVLKVTAGAEMGALWVDTMVAEALAEVAGKPKRERKPTEKVLAAAEYAQMQTTKSRKRAREVAGSHGIERPKKKKKTHAAVQEREQDLATFYDVTNADGNQYRFEVKLKHPTWMLSSHSIEERRREEAQTFNDALKRESSSIEDVAVPQKYYVLEFFLDNKSEGRQSYSTSTESEYDDASTPLLQNTTALKSKKKMSSMVEQVFEDHAVKSDIYCTCRPTKQYTEWVGCENDDCKIAWYHLRCVGLKKWPSNSQNWYCPACRGVDSTQQQDRKGQVGTRLHSSVQTRESASVASSD